MKPRVKQSKVNFCTHLDLLDGAGAFRPQRKELEKVCAWLRPQSEEDFLKYVRVQVKGVTSPQLYVKVPGVWTGAHEENMRLRSINVNHGPGSNEWGGVAREFVPKLRRAMLEEHAKEIYLSEGLFIPPLPFLIRHKIPVLHGMQHATETVAVGIGCVHWVYSRGKLTCSAWNIGELSIEQVEAALERRRLNEEVGES